MENKRGSAIVFFHISAHHMPAEKALSCLCAVSAQHVTLSEPGALFTENHVCGVVVGEREFPCLLIEIDEDATVEQMQQELENNSVKLTKKAVRWAAAHAAKVPLPVVVTEQQAPSVAQLEVAERHLDKLVGKTQTSITASSSAVSCQASSSTNADELHSNRPARERPRPEVHSQSDSRGRIRQNPSMLLGISSTSSSSFSSSTVEGSALQNDYLEGLEWVRQMAAYVIPQDVLTTDGQPINKETFFKGLAGDGKWAKAALYAMKRLFSVGEFLASYNTPMGAPAFHSRNESMSAKKMVALYALIIHYRVHGKEAIAQPERIHHDMSAYLSRLRNMIRTLVKAGAPKPPTTTSIFVDEDAVMKEEQYGYFLESSEEKSLWP
ncbi:hypothetical protein BV898_12803 [Hypsibius exemplaris]|uniref:Uncharacterized protein n=1 Tax=Hypsibius exemplaris TaxID=2072580 RepID=A0A1W0WCS8_HYPEX|nr:hypothetical protein BV898_12803 [Hypsibius exemplaris]